MQVASLERRLAAVEGREASLMAELRSAEASLAERDAALAAAAGLREQLSESAQERGQLQHHKQVGGGSWDIHARTDMHARAHLCRGMHCHVLCASPAALVVLHCLSEAQLSGLAGLAARGRTYTCADSATLFCCMPAAHVTSGGRQRKPRGQHMHAGISSQLSFVCCAFFCLRHMHTAHIRAGGWQG
jgi:hypothetical protein